MNEKLFEFRIKYNAGEFHSVMNSYHYYMAETPLKAFSFHIQTLMHKKSSAQNLCIEKYNPYSRQWENCPKVICEENSSYYYS